MAIDIEKALSLLDKELSKKKLRCELRICGGAALILMGIVSRETIDVDVVSKEIPKAVLKAAKIVAQKLNYPETWLNNDVSPLIERLPMGWEDHLVPVYSGKAITVKSISRQDLIELKPTLSEIEIASRYCLRQASNENYELWVNGYVRQLKKDLGLA